MEDNKNENKLVFNNKEYDREWKKEMREMVKVIDDNPCWAESILNSYHKNYVKAVFRKERGGELYCIHRFLPLYNHAKKTLEPKLFNKIDKGLKQHWKGIL